MDNHAITIGEAIGNLAATKKPIAAQLIAELMTEMDAALEKGATLDELAALLTANGVPVTAKYLANARCRIRKKEKAGHARRKTAPAPAAKTTAPAQPATGMDWKKHRDTNPDW